MEQVTILGSTGSIGVQTLQVIAMHPENYKVFALTACSRWKELAEQCLRYQPEYAVLAEPENLPSLRNLLKESGSQTQVLSGCEALAQVAGDAGVDTVVAAIVGAAGVTPTLAAVKAGKKILLANKEALVVTGQLFMDAVKQHGASLLPVDSEHNAIFQCLPEKYDSAGQAGIRKLLLTASGGPFRTFSVEELHRVTPEQAVKHPNWDMGKKISIDSATMMNKGLELIEACWLFDMNESSIEVVVHPQSVVHSMVEYLDGSVLAQLGSPDMRTPIANALSWPGRIDSGVESLDFSTLQSLTFEAPDEQRFPCLRLARQVARYNNQAAVVLNASNEEAVQAFLDKRIGFMDIPAVIDQALERWEPGENLSLEEIMQLDQQVRVQVQADLLPGEMQ